MTTSTAIRDVVRNTVETAQVEWIRHDQETHLGEVHFAVAARSRIQGAATTVGRLVEIAEACEEEMLRQITQLESIDGAAAAMKLREALLSITHPRKRWIMDRDGIFQPDC